MQKNVKYRKKININPKRIYLKSFNINPYKIYLKSFQPTTSELDLKFQPCVYPMPSLPKINGIESF